jgi:hypothetical protein
LYSILINNLLFVNGSNVGIGTSLPTEKLMVNGSLRVQNSSGTLALYVNESTGNVGIGTTEPGAALDVRSGEIRTADALVFTDSAGTPYTDNWIGMVNSIDGDSKWLHIGGITSTKTGDSTAYRRIALFADRTYFSGNVGIGTTTPGAKLHVKGEERIEDESSSGYKVKKIVKSWSAPGTGWHTFYTASQYEGYSLYANVLYEDDSADGNDVGAIFHMAYYGYGSVTATRISGSTNLNITTDTSGNFQVKHSAGGTTSNQHLTIYAEIVTRS